MNATKPLPNEYGVIWAPSKNGKLQIAVQVPKLPGSRWEVWALYTGTHDLAPVAKSFTSETCARAYANSLWKTR